jgi:hypothetical protein
MGSSTTVPSIGCRTYRGGSSEGGCGRDDGDAVAPPDERCFSRLSFSFNAVSSTVVHSSELFAKSMDGLAVNDNEEEEDVGAGGGGGGIPPFCW